jgi:tetratricopeptide (TPR) repeat protein
VEDGAYLWAENAQVKFLSGYHNIPFGSGSRAHLEHAKHNVKQNLAFTGIAERFDESLILLKRLFQWRTPYYIRENVSRKQVRRSDLSVTTIQCIEKYQQLDRRLYDYASERFEVLLEEQDEHFFKELEVFKLLNPQCQRYIESLNNEDGFEKAEIQIVEDSINRLFRENKTDKADLILKFMLGKYSHSAKLLNLQGSVHLHQGAFDKAAEIFRRLTVEQPDHSEAYANYGAVLWQTGERPNALNHFMHALKLDENNRDAVMHLGKALSSIQHQGEARRLYDLYLDNHPRDGEILHLRNHS